MNPPPVVPTVRPLSTSAAAKLDAAGNVAVDVACRRCGYNLRTLPSVGKCPECGTAVGRSLHGDLLQYSDPEWVEKLAGGMNWIIASVIIAILTGMIIEAVTTMIGGTGGADFNTIAAPLMELSLGAVGLVGYWMFTTPDPGKVEPEKPTSVRNLVRGTAVFNYLASPIAQALVVALPLISVGISVLSALVGIVGMFAIFLYAISLADRIPDVLLARSCRTVMWGIVVVMVGGIVMAVLSSIAPGGPAPAGLLAFAGCFVGVGSLVFGIWAIILVIRFRKAMVKAAQTARVTWATPHGPAVVPVPAPPRPLT